MPSRGPRDAAGKAGTTGARGSAATGRSGALPSVSLASHCTLHVNPRPVNAPRMSPCTIYVYCGTKDGMRSREREGDPNAYRSRGLRRRCRRAESPEPLEVIVYQHIIGRLGKKSPWSTKNAIRRSPNLASNIGESLLRPKDLLPDLAPKVFDDLGRRRILLLNGRLWLKPLIAFCDRDAEMKMKK